MREFLLVLILLSCSQGMAQRVDLESASLRRQDLPEKFPYQLADEGFAVIRLKVMNRTEQHWTLSVDEIEVYDKKGKRVKRALPADITPKILKYYTGIHGYGGLREGRSGDPIVSLDTVEGLRRDLERHQIKDAALAPGESVEALYYLKSKASGSKLSGGWVILHGIRADF